MKNLILTVLLIFCSHAFSQDTISTDKAKDYLDKVAVVKGKVMSFKLASDGKTTNYINIDKKYPDNIFTIVVTNDYLKKQNIKIEELLNKQVYIKGKISVYKNDPKQLPQIFNPQVLELKKD